MPATKRKPKPKRDASGWIKPVAFRLDATTLAHIDREAARLSSERGIAFTRTDAIRTVFAESPANRGEKKSGK